MCIMLVVKFHFTTPVSLLRTSLSALLVQARTSSRLCMVVMLVSDSIPTLSNPSCPFLESSGSAITLLPHGLPLVDWLRAEPVVGHSWPSMIWPQPSFAVFSLTNPLVLLSIYLTVEPKCTPVLLFACVPLLMLFPCVCSSPTIL